MLRQVVAVVALVLAPALALAQDAASTPITSAQTCAAVSDALFNSWQNHKYASKADADKVRPAIKALEDQCNAGNFAEAQKSAIALKALVGAH